MDRKTLEKVCPKCGYPMQASSSVCKKCGYISPLFKYKLAVGCLMLLLLAGWIAITIIRYVSNVPA